MDKGEGRRRWMGEQVKGEQRMVNGEGMKGEGMMGKEWEWRTTVKCVWVKGESEGVKKWRERVKGKGEGVNRWKRAWMQLKVVSFKLLNGS